MATSPTEMMTMVALDEQRRAGVRRTVWIMGGIAFAIFVLFFVQQVYWR